MIRMKGLSILTLRQELEHLDDAISREALLSQLSLSASDRHEARRRCVDLRIQAMLIREQLKEFHGLFDFLNGADSSNRAA